MTCKGPASAAPASSSPPLELLLELIAEVPELEPVERVEDPVDELDTVVSVDPDVDVDEPIAELELDSPDVEPVLEREELESLELEWPDDPEVDLDPVEVDESDVEVDEVDVELLLDAPVEADEPAVERAPDPLEPELAMGAVDVLPPRAAGAPHAVNNMTHRYGGNELRDGILM